MRETDSIALFKGGPSQCYEARHASALHTVVAQSALFFAHVLSAFRQVHVDVGHNQVTLITLHATNCLCRC
jgi:hypothetical protein